MTLGELIKFLEAQPPELVLPVGLANAHSYRGYYDQLAFEPASDVKVAMLLREANDAIGRTFEGWKGGQYTMHTYTDVHVANWGQTGEELGPFTLHLMLRLATTLFHTHGGIGASG